MLMKIGAIFFFMLNKCLDERGKQKEDITTSARKPLLSQVQVKRRIKWCKAYLAYGPADWNEVIFSDKCSVQTFRNIRRYVWRPKNCRYNTNYTTKTVKYGGISLMVWGAIRSDAKES